MTDIPSSDPPANPAPRGLDRLHLPLLDDAGWSQERVSEKPGQSYQSSASEYFAPLRRPRNGAAYDILKGRSRVHLLLTLLELVPYIEGALDTAGRILHQTPLDQLGEIPRNLRVELADRSGRVLED